MPLQSLEDYITAQLSAIQLDVPPDDIEYIARLVEEEELEEQDKKDGVKGMLEGLGSDAVDEAKVDDSVEKIIEHWHGIKTAADAEAEAEKDKDGEGSDEESSDSDGEEGKKSKDRRAANKALIASLTPEELAAAQKRALLAQYGYVEDDAPPVRDGNGPPVGETARKREEEKAAAERRAMIDKALREDSMKKSKRKKLREREGHDLWAPNLNRAKVDAKAQMQREAARQQAQAKKDRDKAALEKQRADQAKAKLEKQKKAAKGERRA